MSDRSVLSTSSVQPMRPAKPWYISNRSRANRLASSPPSAPRISTMTLRPSLGSLGSSSSLSFSAQALDVGLGLVGLGRGTAPCRRPRTREQLAGRLERRRCAARSSAADLDDLLELAVAPGGVARSGAGRRSARDRRGGPGARGTPAPACPGDRTSDRGYRWARPGRQSPSTGATSAGRTQVGDHRLGGGQDVAGGQRQQQRGVGIDLEPGVGGQDRRPRGRRRRCRPPRPARRRACRRRRRRPRGGSRSRGSAVGRGHQLVAADEAGIGDQRGAQPALGHERGRAGGSGGRGRRIVRSCSTTRAIESRPSQVAVHHGGERPVVLADADLEDRLAVVERPDDADDLEPAELAGEAVALDHDVEAAALEQRDQLGGVGRAGARVERRRLGLDQRRGRRCATRARRCGTRRPGGRRRPARSSATTCSSCAPARRAQARRRPGRGDAGAESARPDRGARRPAPPTPGRRPVPRPVGRRRPRDCAPAVADERRRA